MDNAAQSVQRSLMSFRVKRCCWLVPLRGGLIALGYFNLAVGVVLAVGTSSGSLAPLLQRAQMALMEGESYPSVCIVSPVVDVAAAVLLLCGLHREDVRLLSVFSAVSACCVVLSVAVYVVLCAMLSALDLIAIFCSEVYQVYVIFLVRSLIIDIRLKHSSYLHCGGGGVLVTKVSTMPPLVERGDVERQVSTMPPLVERGDIERQVSTMPPLVERVDVESQVELPESSTESSPLDPDHGTVQPPTDPITQHEPVPMEMAHIPEVSEPAAGIEVAVPTPPGPVPPPATDTTAVVSVPDRGSNGNDDVTVKSRRKLCRVM